MKVLSNPSQEELKRALLRPALQAENLETIIEEIFRSIEKSGDNAVSSYNDRFDHVKLSSLELTEQEWSQGEKQVPEKLKAAIRTAARNIERFHSSQMSREREVETSPGVFCWRKSVAIQNVGLYIPGGTAPLFSTVLMLGIPAGIAGCKNRILCTPPSANGSINPAILYAAKVAGINRVFKVGGAQAIAAMSIGTESIPKVDKLFGPGNQYVTAAKMYAQRFGVAIDMPAGPSEVLVAADNSVPAAFIAADLLAQAEHGTDSQVVFLTDDVLLAEAVQLEVNDQLKQLPRAAIAAKSLEKSVVIIADAGEWVNIINDYAPEHLIAMGKYEESVSQNVVNAGSVFIGMYTAESFGDYASGTNHTLPTAGFARSYSGVSLDSFVKKITYQRVTEKGLLSLGQTVVTMAEAELLQGHADAVMLRYKSLVPPDSLSMTASSLPENTEDKLLVPSDSLSMTASSLPENTEDKLFILSDSLSMTASSLPENTEDKLFILSDSLSMIASSLPENTEDKSLVLSDSLSMTASSLSENTEDKLLVPSDSLSMTGVNIADISVVRLSTLSETECVSKPTTGFERFIRPDLRTVKPYSSARDEYEGKAAVFLDANENGLLEQFNRYPDPQQRELKRALSKVKGIPEQNLFLGNGSDEVLDLIFRLTATPYLDSVASLNPSYGMYSVLAATNGLEFIKINLDEHFQLSVEAILQQSERARILVICNPNNPTGGIISKNDLIEIVQRFRGIVVVDEAYVDFCPEYSLVDEINHFPNLLIVQTLSKAFGMAGLRIGMAVASEEWIKALNAIKPPYNLSSVVQEMAIKLLNGNNWESVKQSILSEQNRLIEFLRICKSVKKVFPSKANFILFRVENADEIYRTLEMNGVIVRNRSKEFNCENTLRVSVGNKSENERFIEIMKSL